MQDRIVIYYKKIVLHRKDITLDIKLEQLCNNIAQSIFLNRDKYIVYMHINKYNNKKYVGFTCQNPPQKRWKSGYGYCHNSYFTHDIKEYGWKSFIHYVLFVNISYENACVIEQYLVKELQLQNVKYGYNIASGGNVNPMLGKHHTKKSREKMSYKLCDRYATNPESHPWFGRHHTEESKQKMRKHSPNCQKIICVETQIIYSSIYEATRLLRLKSKNSIIIALNDPSKTAKGYHWKRINEEIA